MKVFFSLPEFDGQLLRTLSYTIHGGADIGECLTTAARIKEGDFDSWYQEWTFTADRLVQMGDQALQQDNLLSASECYLRASNYYRTAYFFLFGFPLDERLVQAYDLHAGSFNKAASLFTHSAEAIRIPFEETFIPGYFYKPNNSEKQRPTIITGPGYDGTHQECYLSTAISALKRGYNVLCYEGPGQGELLIKHAVYMRYDWEKVVTPLVDFLLQRSEVDASSLILIGTSWGGMLAPRAAAFEHRLAALVVNPGQYDALQAMKRLLPQTDAQLEAQDHAVLDEILKQILSDKMMAARFKSKMWVHGLETAFELLKDWKNYTLVDVAPNILCPTLIIDSENEPMSAGQAKQLFDALQCQKDYVLFKSSEGAGEHCAAGAQGLLDMRIFDWISNKINSLSLLKS